MEQGKIVSLQVCVGHREPMASRERVVVTEAGLEGDRHANVNGLRQILLMEKEILDGLSLTPGTIRENVTITGLAIHGLAAGERVRLGSDVVLEVTGLCEPCSRMDEIRGRATGDAGRTAGGVDAGGFGRGSGFGGWGGGWGVG